MAPRSDRAASKIKNISDATQDSTQAGPSTQSSSDEDTPKVIRRRPKKGRTVATNVEPEPDIQPAHHASSNSNLTTEQSLIQAVARQLAILPRNQWYLTRVPPVFLREARRLAASAELTIHWYWWPWPQGEEQKEKPHGSNSWQRRELDLLWELMGQYEKWYAAKRGEIVNLDVDVSADEVLVKWDDVRYCNV